MDSMDFHSLSRRELQSLCKKNKIPANMTNIAMADALTALTNVIGIEEIGQSDSTMPETPLTSRRTTVRKTATKPQAVESESTQTITRPRRATAKKIVKEDDPKEFSETTSVNETPAPRGGRKRVTGTSVCRKLDEQTQEVKEESKEERPVVHSYSTRRSSRLQSGQKITESVQKRGGRKNEAVMIGVLSEEDTDDVPVKSNSDVQENQGDNVKVLSPIPQEDLISEDGSSSTLVSADVSSYIEEVSSANHDLISESKDGFSAEQSSEQQDMSTEVSSCFNDALVSEISVSGVTLISESKDVTALEDDAHVDQVMSPEESKVASDEFDNMDIKEESAVEVTVASPNVMLPEVSKVASDEFDSMDIKEEPAVEVTVASTNVMSPEDSKIASDEFDSMDVKEEPAVEVTVASPNVSTKKIAQMREASPLKETTIDQVDDMTNEDMMVESNGRSEAENAVEYGLKFSFEDDFSDSEAEVVKSPFDFDNMKETMECISNLEISNQVEVTSRVEASIECEKLIGNEMQVYETTDLPVLNLTDATVLSPSEVASKDNQVKPDDSDSVEQLENQKVDSVKCDSIANEEGVKVDSLLDDASTEEDDSNDESDDNDESVDEDESDDDDETVGEDESDEEVESDDNVDDSLESPIAGVVNIQNPVTPVKSPSAKKIATPNSKMMIKVLEDTEESNKSGKVSLKSNSKLLLTPGVAEQKENNDNNKGESTAQKSMKKKSLRQLKKILKEKEQVIKMLKEMKITSDSNETTGKEDLQVEKRTALQMLNDNCLLAEEGK